MRFRNKLIFFFFLLSVSLGLSKSTEAATNVYYSVGQSNSTELMTGTPDVTVASGVATFTVSQTGNIGVGDQVIIGVTTMYISGKIDTSRWNVVTNLGTVPDDISTPTAVTHIYRTFASLSDAINNADGASYINNANLVAADVVLNIPCYYDTGADVNAVTITGYITDTTRYMRIYTPSNTITEANNSQRHSGKWDSTKWRMEISNNTAILLRGSLYIRIEGIQIQITTTANNQYAISATTINTDNSIYLNNNILAGDTSGGFTGRGFTNDDADTILYAWNNIIYGWSYTSSYGLYLYYVGSSYVYNNTLIDNYYGIRCNSGNSIAKNNIVKGSGDAYIGTFATGTDYNATDGTDAIGMGSNNRISQVFTFVDGTNKDFHLASSDAGARNHGTDQVSEIVFTTDIDGDTRPAGASWDIGADEKPFAQIYRSVGPSATDALDTGSASDTLTISGTAATFATAVDDAVGAGDVIQFNISGTYYLAFITGRTDSTHYAVANVSGTAPQAVTGNDNWNIYRSYTSLANAEKGDENGSLDDTVENFDDWTAGGGIDDDEAGKDITSATGSDEQWNIACYQGQGGVADTAAVVTNGWTTASANYIRIYTPYRLNEVGTSQRHPGKWDTGKYRLSVTSNSDDALIINDGYAKIDGLQVSITSTANDNDGIAMLSDTAGSLIEISNNIIKGVISGTAEGSGISAGDNTMSYTTKIWNNIVYDFINGATDSAGIHMGVQSGSNGYVYNNTIQNCYAGINRVRGNVYAKNNIVKGSGNTNAYVGTFASGTDYNATDGTDSVGQGTHNRISQTFAFANEAGDDFHLSSSDTGARNFGGRLSGDAALPFATDVDGQARPASSAGEWDIGADEEGPRAVFYSVGQDASTNNMSGSPAVTISGGVATFTVAQTGNIGVGDRITYNTDDVAYLSGKISTTQWNVVTAQGLVPADISASTVVSIKREYTTLETAVANAMLSGHLNTADLVAGNYTLNIPCYYDTAAETTAVTVNGYTTGSNNYIKIYTPVGTDDSNTSQRHSGKWDTNKYRMDISGATAVTVQDHYVKIVGLALKSTNTAHFQSVVYIDDTTPSSEVLLDSSYIEQIGNYASEGVHIENGTSAIVRNCIVYGNTTYIHDRASGINVAYGVQSSYVEIIQNCTVRGFYRAYRVSNSSTSGTLTMQNNLAYGAAYANFDIAAISGGTRDYNASSDTTNTGGAHDRVSQTFSFVDAAGKDFHLKGADGGARNYGADLSSDFTDDIDGQARPYDASWDIGADEWQPLSVYYSVGQDTATNLMTGSPAVTISSGTAAFSVPQTGNIGVGDRVTYNTSSIAYISGKVNTSEWTLVTATGGVPADISGSTVVSIKREYASLFAAEAGASDADHLNTLDLAAGNYRLNLPCYYDTGADTTAVTVDDWTTSAGNYIKIYTPVGTDDSNVSQRHSGVWSDGKYNLAWTTDNDGITISDNDVKVIGLQLYDNANFNGANGINFLYINGIEIANNIIRNNPVYLRSRIGLYNNNYGLTNKVYNNLIYDFNGESDQYAMMLDAANTRFIYVYNNTIVNCYTGIYSQVNPRIVAKNNLIKNTTNPAVGTFPAGTDYNVTDSASIGYTVTGGGNVHDRVSQTVQFVNEGGKDFHLSPGDASAANYGANLSADAGLVFSTDIDGQARSVSEAWDVGADESGKVSEIIRGTVKLRGNIKFK